MRYSRAFIPTLKEVPKEATTPSHVLLLRAGYARPVGAGLYEFLPLGARVLHKVTKIIRQEMDRAGGQQILMPAMLPADYFKESGRWESFGDALIRFQDRKGADYHLGPTHEEIVTDIARREVQSYRQLPLNLYQVQTKFRDEPRPRAGLLRCREFVMKDAYSFDVDEAHALESYAVMRDAYHRVFTRLGLDYRVVAADSGAMGGSTSAEFQILAQQGEDAIVACSQCEYAANVEIAAAATATADGTASGAIGPKEKVHTPGVKTIDEVAAFLKLEAHQTLKSLLYTTGQDYVMVVLRGDHTVNETKLARHLGAGEVFLASDEDVRAQTGGPVGATGPVGFSGTVLVDRSAAVVRDGVVGANEADQHYVHVQHGRDFQGEEVDLRQVENGDPCPSCGHGLARYRAIEGGHIFVLGTHYSAKMGATYLNAEGQSVPLVMGCYGIGVSRMVAAAVEQHHDDDGICWPMAIAPYQVIVTPLGKDSEVHEAAEGLYRELLTADVEVLLDDRDERPGVKFKDADLLGIPLRVTVGKRGLVNGQIEIKARSETESHAVALGDVADHIKTRIVAAQA